MVWIPDPIVTEFFTRDTAPDASASCPVLQAHASALVAFLPRRRRTADRTVPASRNRARHHCNACLLSFPIGNNASMRTHLLACPSLAPSTILSIQSRIASELTTPKRVTRDPRWTKAEEATLLRLDSEVPSGKKEGKYQVMAGRIGRSAQACRQKLIHLKENKAVKDGVQETTKKVLWNRKARSKKVTVDEDGEEDDGEEGEFEDVAFEDIQQPARNTRSRKVALPPKIEVDDDELSLSPKSKEPARNAADSDATISDPNSPTHRRTSVPANPDTTISAATDEFLRLVRWHIHSALTNFHIVRRFYTSDLSIESGWGAFVASDIPPVEKDRVVARLIGLWLDGLDEEGFEREVDARIEGVVLEMSEWVFEAGNPMRKAIKEASADEEDSGYDGDGSYEEEAVES